MISQHSRHADQFVPRSMAGLASLEYIMALPILLVIFLLMLNVASLALTRLDIIVAARVSSFEQAYGLSGLYWFAGSKVASNGEPIFTRATRQRLPGQSSDFLPFMRRAECSFPCARGKHGDRTSVLVSAPGRPSVGSAGAFFFGDRLLGVFDFAVEAEFAAYAAPIWERSGMRLGYDRYLERDLRTNRALPNAFPGTP